MAIQLEPRSTRIERLETRTLFAATLTTLATFTGKNGQYPQADLTADAAGNLYGVATFGGSAGFGTVFELPVGKHAVTTLTTFDDSNGKYPRTQLLADADGNLYGTAGQGGLYGSGTVFEISATDHTFTKLADFNGDNGYIPGGNIVFDAAGNLYGTTSKGGANDLGTVFKLAAGSHTLTTLATFNGNNGSGPSGGLVADAAGNLYGMTYKGGTNDDGTVFKIAAGNHALTTLVTFDGDNGASPTGNLILDPAGNFYGTTDAVAGGLGSVFEISAGNHLLTTLVTFDKTNEVYTQSGVIADAAGNLYGTTLSQTNGHGTVFKIAAGTHALTTLAAFKGTNGSDPAAGLIADAAGTLYGVANQGGSANFGTIFKLTGAAFGQTPSAPSPAPAPTPIKTVGGLDAAFGTNGLASHDVGFNSTTGNAADGSQSVLIGPVGSAGAQAFGVTRYNADGSLDTSFGIHGVATARFTGTDAVPTTVSVFADGHILVAGTATTSGNTRQFAVAAFNADGSVDNAFGTGGKVLVGFGAASGNDVLHAMAVGSGGTVYLGGRSDAAGAGNADFAVAALNADGSLDTRFGSAGTVLLDIAGGDDIVNSLAVQANGDVVAAGSAAAGDATEVALARFLPTGMLDRHFGGTGFITSQVGSVYDAAESVALQPKGQIVVGGLTASGSDSSVTTDYLVQRYTTTGKPDRSFNKTGSITTPLGQPAAVTQVIVQPDGSIIASGRTSATLGGTLNVAIARYTPQGLLDTAFNRTGTVVIDLGSGATRSASLATAAATAAARLGTLFDAFLSSQQGTVAVTPGGEILIAGSSGDNTVEAELVAAGVDLVTKVLSALPASANGRAKAVLTVTEAGTERAIGSITITLSYTVESTGAGATAATTAVYTLKLRPAKTKVYHLSFAVPDALTAGSYYLMATVVNGPGLPDDLNANNNSAISASAITV